MTITPTPIEVSKLLAIKALRAFMIVMPVIVIYWQANGLTIQHIFWLQVIFSLAVVALEVPSGYFADWFGKRTAMIAGAMCATVGHALMFLGDAFATFVVAELTLALGFSFISGADTALLYQTLKLYEQSSAYQRFAGRLVAIGTTSEAVAAVAATAVVYLASVETVLAVQVLATLPAILIALSLAVDVRDGNERPSPILAIVRGSVRENARLRALHVFSGAIGASMLTMVWLTQPYWQLRGVDVAYFGLLWAGLNLTTAVGATLAHRLEAWFRFRYLFLALALAPIVLYGLMSYFAVTAIAFAVIPGYWLLRGVATPIIQDYVQREARDQDRATILSLNNLSTRILFSVCSPFVGWVADVWSFAQAFAVSALIFGTLTLTGLGLWWLAQRSSVSLRT